MNDRGRYFKSSFLYAVCIPLAVCISFVACTKAEKEIPEIVKRPRTVLLYMVANNNLSTEAESSINKLMRGYVPTEEGNILVYKHCVQMNPVLLHIKKGEDGSVVADTAYKFPPRVSATKTALTQAMNVAKSLFPADDYGLILWSHGTGWIPPQNSASATNVLQGSTGQELPPQFTFGLDGSTEMEITDLAAALPYKLSFMIMDACFMGGIETAYEVKDSVEYYVASPAEILTESFPYDKVMQHLFNTEPDLEAVCREYYNYYNTQSGSSRSATIALLDCSKLDALAEVAKEVFGLYRDRIATLDMTKLQPYFRSSSHKYFYDLKDLVDNIADAALAADFSVALENVVLYEAHTPYFIEMPIARCCGVSTYVPNPVNATLSEYYKRYKWNISTGMIQ